MNYYLEDHPNAAVPQYGWPRTRVSGVVGVHTTESGVVFEGADPGAENTAGYLSRRTNHGSYHIMADWDTIIPLVRPTFAAWADTTNNPHALSVSGAMNAARWRDLTPERAAGIVRNMGIAAAMLVRDAIAHGVLDEIVPARRITAQQAIDGSAKGFYGHGETNPGTRYDPGQNFDWDLFLASYAAAVGGNITYQSATTTDEGFLMALNDEAQQNIYEAVGRIDQWLTNGGPRDAVDAALQDPAVLDRIALAILKRECYSVDPATGQTNGTTTLARKINWMAHNDQAILSAIVDVSKKLDVTHPVLPAEASIEEDVA